MDKQAANSSSRTSSVDEYLYSMRARGPPAAHIGDNRETSGATSSQNTGSAGATSSQNTGSAEAQNGATIYTSDFWDELFSSGNYYVSQLTQEQIAVLRAVRPNAVHEFLKHEIKARRERAIRRNRYSKCGFCKKNGESAEFYSSHTLKDCFGRVLCPVLRGFCCPRCGATGDRAHTIRYCPEDE